MHILRQDEREPTAIWSPRMRGGYARWEPGFECEYHCHQDADEVFVFLAGQCEITVEGERRLCQAGETVYTSPGERHRLKAVGPEALVMFLVVAPNHSPTHTISHPDGRVEHRDRSLPERRVP